MAPFDWERNLFIPFDSERLLFRKETYITRRMIYPIDLKDTRLGVATVKD